MLGVANLQLSRNVRVVPNGASSSRIVSGARTSILVKKRTARTVRDVHLVVVMVAAEATVVVVDINSLATCYRI